MRIEKENLTLPCILTDAKKLNYGHEQAISLQRLEEAEARKQEFNSQIKADIEKYEARAHEIGHKLTSGKEYRDVECTITRDWEKKTRTWTRTDTGEVVKEDIIPDFELQEEMELQDKKNKKDQRSGLEIAAEIIDEVVRDSLEVNGSLVERAAEQSKVFDDPKSNIVHFEQGKVKGKAKKS